VKQVLKALELEGAFEKVLDTPGAVEALRNPALKAFGARVRLTERGWGSSNAKRKEMTHV
jgi:hypothetical protein